MDAQRQAEARLVKVLRGAYSGELAAALAYAGHARSVRDPDEAAEIRRVRAEELEHRERVGAMLAALGAGPSPERERVFRAIGVAIAAFCRVGGWFAPMYGAARLERGNVGEYELAARHALDAGRAEWVDDLLTMAEVEHDHERWFREKAASHPLWRVFPHWEPLPPREHIRRSLTIERGARGLAPEAPGARPTPVSSGTA